MERLTSISEKLGRLPRVVKVGVGLATLAGLTRAHYELTPKPEVSVLNLQGVIMSGKASPLSGGQPPLNLENLRKRIDMAFRPKRLKCVLLNINSPGGSPVQCDLIASYIQQKAEEKNVPVVAFVEDVAASGGYWLACAAGQIFVARSSVVGSIGVIGAGFGFTEGMEKVGVERRVFTAGKSKSQLDPFRPLKEEDVARQQVILDSLHQHFIDHVTTSRGGRLAEGEELFTGEYWTGERAVELGLVDGLSLLEPWLAQNFGKEGRDVRVFRMRSGGLLESLLSTLAPSLLPSLAGLATAPMVEARDAGVEALVESALR